MPLPIIRLLIGAIHERSVRYSDNAHIGVLNVIQCEQIARQLTAKTDKRGFFQNLDLSNVTCRVFQEVVACRGAGFAVEYLRKYGWAT